MRLAEWAQGHEEVRVTAPGTDIRLGIAGAEVHRRRRQAQHAGRRVLHGADRGLGRGRGELSPAGDGRRARGGGRARCGSSRERSSTPAPSAARSSWSACSTPTRARAGWASSGSGPTTGSTGDPRRAARREDRRHRSHGRWSELSGVRRQERERRSHGPRLRSPRVAAGSRSTARRSRRTAASWSEIEHAGEPHHSATFPFLRSVSTHATP